MPASSPTYHHAGESVIKTMSYRNLESQTPKLQPMFSTDLREIVQILQYYQCLLGVSLTAERIRDVQFKSQGCQAHGKFAWQAQACRSSLLRLPPLHPSSWIHANHKPCGTAMRDYKLSIYAENNASDVSNSMFCHLHDKYAADSKTLEDKAHFCLRINFKMS